MPINRFTIGVRAPGASAKYVEPAKEKREAEKPSRNAQVSGPRGRELVIVGRCRDDSSRQAICPAHTDWSICHNKFSPMRQIEEGNIRSGRPSVDRALFQNPLHSHESIYCFLHQGQNRASIVFWETTEILRPILNCP